MARYKQDLKLEPVEADGWEVLPISEYRKADEWEAMPIGKASGYIAIAFLRGFVLYALIMLAIVAVALGISAVAKGEPLPKQPAPLGVPPTAAEIELGRKLFFDKRLSADGSVACATCHNPKLGWSDGRPVAVGIGNQFGTRNSPTIINSAWLTQVFWDGRTTSSSAQALLPLSNPIEMGQQSEAQVIARMLRQADLVQDFARVFGVGQRGEIIDGLRLARSIAAFETTIVSSNAPIDRFREGDPNALTPDARIGYDIFVKSNCMVCHPPPLYTTHQFVNNGSEFAGKQRATDPGRFNVASSGRGPETVRAFKVPTLREVHRTGPYMHAGQFDSLERVVAHYNSGGANFEGRRDRFIDQRIKKLDLTETQADYLVIFLKEAFAAAAYPDIEGPP